MLTCLPCPHTVGANCSNANIEWPDVIATPGWYTAGTRNGVHGLGRYYECPQGEMACIGGFFNGTGSNSTVKARCGVGYTGKQFLSAPFSYMFKVQNSGWNIFSPYHTFFA